MKQARDLPTGTVTFLFTDIEGSTKLLQRTGDRFRQLLEAHGRILREAIAHGGGGEVRTEGDSFFVAFDTPAGAVRAAVHAQRALAGHPWPNSEAIRVRMGLHTGEGLSFGGGDYIGLDVHRAARIAAAGHGGQVLLSDATRSLVGHALPSGVGLRDLGLHRLKDLERPEHLHQLVIDALPADFPPVQSLDVRLTNLPPERTSFIGREREVAEIADLFRDARLVTLTGPGGAGKTRLALRVGMDQLARFPDGVYLTDLSPITNPALVPSSIAEALGVRDQPERELLRSVADHLTDRDLLLILDNFEQVMAAAVEVGRLLDAALALRVLVTSRAPLHLSGEREYAVPPLDLPDPKKPPNIEALGGYEAVTLFVDRAKAIRPGFRLTETNAPAVADITARLDGLPLAIELAAGRTKLLTPEALLDRLERSLPLLSGGARDLPERQRTLRRTIEWSYDLLEPEQQRLFARLAVFSGGWNLDAAERVCGPALEIDVIEGLASLLDNSLIYQGGASEEESRFTMLETLKEYGTERLAASGEEHDTRRRHAEFFRDLAEDAAPPYVSDITAPLDGRVDRENDNIWASLMWAEGAGETLTAVRVAAAAWRSWLRRGRLAECRAAMERVLTSPSIRARDALRLQALMALGGMAFWQNDYGPAKAALEEAAEIARELKDARWLAHALFRLEPLARIERDWDRAADISREGLSSAEEADDASLAAQFRGRLGFLNVYRGDPAAALQPLREALAVQREAGVGWATGSALLNLGRTELLLRDLASAGGHLREALEIFVETRNPLMKASAMVGLSQVASAEGRHERAARLLGAAARIDEESDARLPPEIEARFGDPEADARRVIGDQMYEQARADGYGMDTGTAVSYALSDADSRERG